MKSTHWWSLDFYGVGYGLNNRSTSENVSANICLPHPSYIVWPTKARMPLLFPAAGHHFRPHHHCCTLWILRPSLWISYVTLEVGSPQDAMSTCVSHNKFTRYKMSCPLSNPGRGDGQFPLQHCLVQLWGPHSKFFVFFSQCVYIIYNVMLCNRPRLFPFTVFPLHQS